MERFGGIFLIAGVVTFMLGGLLQGFLPVLTHQNIPLKALEEVTAEPPLDFYQLAEDYPEEFSKYFGTPNAETFREALVLGKRVYIAEACWHCHSQFVRPVSKEDLRFGPVSTAEEYKNEMSLPHLFGTRRVGPDLIRESGKHSNDWHVAHFYEPRFVSPYSVMPGYPWFFDENKRPNKKGLAIVTYVQWLGSWVDQLPENIYNIDAIRSER